MRSAQSTGTTRSLPKVAPWRGSAFIHASPTCFCRAAHVASNGIQGLAALDQRPYALVLMDCLMPEMDGYTATAELRRREDAAGRPRIPVIALTASARPEDRRRCLEAGMDDFLSKPIRSASLEAMLGRWVANRVEAADLPVCEHPSREGQNGHDVTGVADRDAPATTGGLTPAPSGRLRP